MASTLTPSVAAWVIAVSAKTGIDPRVLIAWTKSEGHPGDQPGYFNPLNIQTATAQSLGIPVRGTGPAGTASFGSLSVGVAAAVKEIQSLGITSARGQSPKQAISTIAASPWASSHYGGPGGPNLQSVFAGIFGESALNDAYLSSANAAQVVATVGTGSAADAASGGTSIVTKPVEAVTSAVSSVTDFVKLLGDPNNWLRVGEVIAGGVLILVGVFLLAKQVGLTTSVPTPAGAVASAAGQAVS